MQKYILKLLLTAISATIFISTSVQAQSVRLGKETAEIFLRQTTKGGATLEIKKDGEVIQRFENLGERFERLQFNGSLGQVLRVDLDKDGYQELIVRTSQPPFIGSLWVFKWDKEQKLFSHALNGRGDRSVAVPLSGKVVLDSRGRVTFKLPKSGTLHTLRWNGREFLAI